ncbi:MAG: NAD+ synthase [Phycisphaeraceae bacterium]
MRIALAQTNPTIGDIRGNTEMLRRSIREAGERDADLVVFPEMAILGYPPKDLLLKPAVIEQSEEAVRELAAECVKIAAIIGFPMPCEKSPGRSLYNAAAFCQGGLIAHRHLKSLLPTYDVFDELRYFEPGPRVDLTTFQGVKLGISICEDMWNDSELFARPLYQDNPIDELATLGAQLFINCSASPFVVGKHDFRAKLIGHAAKRFGLPVLYCNQVGGNDELVFDGCSCAFDAQGNLIAQAKAFAEDLLIVDLPELGFSDGARPTSCGGVSWSVGEGAAEAVAEGRDEAEATAASTGHLDHPSAWASPASSASAPSNVAASTTGSARTPAASTAPKGRIEPICRGIESVYHALVLGLRDYCRKCGFKAVVLGLSGGIDSALTAALAVAALGKENVRGVAMPSRFSSDHSVSDAKDLAARLGIQFDVVIIEPAHAAFESMLKPIFNGLEPGVAEENVQARVRGVTLMAMSNKFGSLLVTTGNKSELAVGYCTLYGDMAGGLAILSDVPKTMVWQLSRWINESESSPLRQAYGKPVIPESSITKVPSAELRPDQTDQDSLPPYDVLDQIIERYVEREQSARQIIEETSIDVQTVLRMVRLIDLNEYKRKQAAPGLKVTGRAFGFGRRMPIAQRYDARHSGI